MSPAGRRATSVLAHLGLAVLMGVAVILAALLLTPGSLPTVTLAVLSAVPLAARWSAPQRLPWQMLATVTPAVLLGTAKTSDSWVLLFWSVGVGAGSLLKSWRYPAAAFGEAARSILAGVGLIMVVEANLLGRIVAATGAPPWIAVGDGLLAAATFAAVLLLSAPLPVPARLGGGGEPGSQTWLVTALAVAGWTLIGYALADLQTGHQPASAAVIAAGLVVVATAAAAASAKVYTLRTGLRIIHAAAAAMPWPPEQTDAELRRHARDATSATQVEIEERRPAGQQTGRRLSIPVESRRDLAVYTPADRAPVTGDELKVLESLVALTRASRRSAQREAVLQQQMAIDPLTGLGSYPRFREGLRSLATSCAADGRFAVLFLDLDHFKTINTRLGHLDADQVLREVGHRIAATAPAASSITGRFGGDEFLVGVGLPDGQTEPVHRLVEALTARIRQPMRIGEQLLQVNVSVGSAIGDHHDEDIDAVIRQAETTMRAAKRASTTHGPPRWVAERQRVRELLDGREIRVQYQPIVDLLSGHIAGFEALLRVTDPEMGTISPETLVDAAARIRLLDELTLMISEQALQAMTQVASLTRHRLRLSLNLQFEQLRSDNVTLSWLVERFDDAPIGLLLEVSEREALAWSSAHEEVALGLRRQGIELAIDDFGAGYATYRFLEAWQWAAVKIDRGLVSASDRYGQLLLRHVAALLAELATPAVAEGIETPAELETVRGLGIRYGQGYYLGRPMTAAQMIDGAAQGLLDDPVGWAAGRR